MSAERIALILNGAIVLTTSLLTLLDERFVWLVLLMGGSLVYSGVSGFCGWKVILAKLQLVQNDHPDTKMDRRV